jgi:hypothetical protein
VNRLAEEKPAAALEGIKVLEKLGHCLPREEVAHFVEAYLACPSERRRATAANTYSVLCGSRDELEPQHATRVFQKLARMGLPEQTPLVEEARESWGHAASQLLAHRGDTFYTLARLSERQGRVFDAAAKLETTLAQLRERRSDFLE